MTQALTWNDVLARTDLIGGELEMNEDGMVFRGPIAAIEKKGHSIYFTLPWIGQLNPQTKEWNKLSTILDESVSCEVQPTDLGDGKIQFSMPFMSVATIFPNDTELSKLDASKVKGLDKESTRLLALYPDLAFDREKARKVLFQLHLVGMHLEPLMALPPEATIQDFLSTFKYDSSAEEFLWAYIELMTGEKDVGKKVY